MVEKIKNAIKIISDREAGQAFVELALTIPALFLVLVGGAELARIAYFSNVVENAAHAGALYAAQNTVTASDTADITTVADNEAANISTISTLTVSAPSHACTCFDPVAGTNSSMATCFATCASPDTILQSVTVNTSAKLNTLFHYPGLAGSTITVYGSSTVPVSQ